MSLENNANKSSLIKELQATIKDLQNAVNILSQSSTTDSINPTQIQSLQRSSRNLLNDLQSQQNNQDDWLPPTPPHNISPQKKNGTRRRALVFAIVIPIILVISWWLITSNQGVTTSDIEAITSPTITDSSTEVNSIPLNEDNLNSPPPEITPTEDNPPLPEDIIEDLNSLREDSENDLDIVVTDEIQPQDTEDEIITPLTLEESLMANILQSIEDISSQYGETKILNLQANFSRSEIKITLTKDWYNLSENQQTELTNKIITQSIKLDLNKVYLFDVEKNLIARKAFIGDEAIILKS